MNWYVASLKTGIPPGSPGSFTAYNSVLKEIKLRGLDLSGCSLVRCFPTFGVLAILARDDVGEKIGELPEVASVVKPMPISLSPSGRWYVNLLAAWEHAIKAAEGFEGACVNLSLSPPASETNVFDPEEPLNRATKAACLRGIVPVLAVGNDGEMGNETMTRWAQADWVISVGATDETGQHVRAYSSKGSRQDPLVGPTVVAYDAGQPFAREGTSHAAQQVTTLVHLLLAFFVDVWTRANLPLNLIGVQFPSLVRRALTQMARPVRAELHECGAGYLSPEIAKEYLRSLSVIQLAEIIEPVVGVVGSCDWGKHLSATQKAFSTLIKSRPVARFDIDTEFEWTRPSFVPGLLRLKSFFLLREGDEFRFTEDFDAARYVLDNAVFEQISILPRAQLSRTLIVGVGAKYPTIHSAIEAAKPWDVIQIAPGTYEESLTLKNGITLLGSQGTVIRSKKGTAVVIDDVVDVTLANLEIAGEDKGCDVVRVYKSVDVIIRNCKVTSEKSNALGIYLSQRCVIRDSDLTGAVNGSCVVFAREWTFEASRLFGKQSGLLIYGEGGKVLRSQIEGETGDGLVWVLRRKQWTQWDPTNVHIYPIGLEKIPASAVCPEAVYQQNFVGWLSEKFYTVQIEDSTVRGARSGVAATFARLLVAKKSTLSSKIDIRLARNKLFRSKRSSLAKLQRHVERNLRSVLYGTEKALIFDVGSGSEYGVDAAWRSIRENMLASARLEGKGIVTATFEYYILKWSIGRPSRPTKERLKLR